MALLMEYWDSIDVGRPELNHSQGFFRRTHSLHEKCEDQVVLMKKITHQQQQPPQKSTKQHPAVAKAKIPAATTSNVGKQNKTNSTTSGYNKENVPSNSHSTAVSSAGSSRAILAVSKVSVVQKGQPTLKKAISTSASNLNAAKPKTLVKQNTAAPIQKLYDYAEIQKKKKEALAQKLKEEEEKELKFKFHAKPIPKSIKAPTIQPKPLVKQQSLKEAAEEKKKKLMKQQSMPILPVVKRPAPIVPSCGDPERIKAMSEHKKQLIEKYKHENVQFKAKPAYVLQKPVFQPKHNFKPAEAKPFKLVLSQRLIKRTEFDKQLHETQLIKQRQEEILKKHQEQMERKQMRQAREFKANPNPFGRGR